MNTCFVIMPFTNELNELYESCYKPTIENNGLKPIVVNKNRDGSPVYSQILSHIQTSYLIIADLTIARPNCYLEVGYTIGQGKQDNLILCCRSDHLTDSPINPRHNHRSLLLYNLIKDFLPKTLQSNLESFFRPILEQHKIHFDLAGYNFLWWDPKKKDDFIGILDKEIKQRLEIIDSKIQTVESNVKGSNPTQATGPTSVKRASRVDIRKRFDEISKLQETELKRVKK